MMRHRDTHSDIRRFQCAYCHKRFSRREYHEKHQSECAKKLNQSCPENGQIFDSISASECSTDPKIEDGDEEGNVPIQDDIGDSILGDVESKIPDGLKPGRVYPCNMCERVFTRSDHLKRHSDTHLNFRPYNCSYCLRLFSRKENQKRHESLCKLRSNATYLSYASGNLDFGMSAMVDGSDNTSNDGETNESKFALDENETIGESSEILSVEGNGAVYTIISNAKKLKISTCPLCSREFTRTDHLKRHIQTHDGLKRYKCQCCQKCFARQDYQVKHEKMCMTKYKYTNPNYGEQKPTLQEDFWKMSGISNDDVLSVAEHNSNDVFDVDSTPTGDENEFDSNVDSIDKYVMPELSRNEYEKLSCDTCSRVFQKRHHLRRHKIGHLGQKPFECNDCGKKFTRLEHMKRHIEKRHNKVMKCSISENETEKFLINKPMLRKKCIQQFTNFARNFADRTSSIYFEKCFDFVASVVIAHEKPTQTHPHPPDKIIKTEAAEPTGLFVNVEECPDPLELYDENNI